MEVIWLELDNTVQLVIPAMALRPVYYTLFPTTEDDS